MAECVRELLEKTAPLVLPAIGICARGWHLPSKCRPSGVAASGKPGARAMTDIRAGSGRRRCHGAQNVRYEAEAEAAPANVISSIGCCASETWRFDVLAVELRLPPDSMTSWHRSPESTRNVTFTAGTGWANLTQGRSRDSRH